MELNDFSVVSAGYQYLIEKFSILGMPNWHTSFISNTTIHHVKEKGGTVEETYPNGYWPGNSIGDHLEFALKYDGVNLSLLYQIFCTTSLNPRANDSDAKNPSPPEKVLTDLFFPV